MILIYFISDRPQLIGIKKKLERREANRERKAEAAARIEKSIEKELIDRLKNKSYGDAPLNVNEEIWQKILDEELEGEEDESEEEDEEEEENEEDEVRSFFICMIGSVIINICKNTRMLSLFLILKMNQILKISKTHLNGKKKRNRKMSATPTNTLHNTTFSTYIHNLLNRLSLLSFLITLVSLL